MNVKEILQNQGIDYEEDSKRFIVLCPFHDDHNPSGGIWKDSGYFRCFRCGVSTNLGKFLSATLGIPESQAYRLTRGEDDISILEDTIRNRLHESDQQFKFFSKKSFHKTYPLLTPDSPQWKYVIDRGITEGMIKRFDMRIGMKKYRDRVILPIYNPEGKLVSYVGRAIIPNIGLKTRKSRSPHRTFFGLFEIVVRFSRKPLLFNIVVVEGEFDAIYLQQFGIAAIANMGTLEMGPEKIRLLRKYAKRVILSYDGDTAGREAMYGTDKKPGQIAELIPHIPTVSVELPEGLDPNTLHKDQVEELYGEYRDFS